MNTEGKKVQESVPAGEYKTHFELWDEASIDDADAPPFANGRRVWTTPVLQAHTIVGGTRRRPAPLAAAPSPYGDFWTMVAAVVAGVMLGFLMLWPRQSATVANPPPQIAAKPAPKAQPSVAASAAKEKPRVAIVAKQSVPAPSKATVPPPKLVASAPRKPAAVPSAAPSPAAAAPQPVSAASTAAISPPSKPAATEPSAASPEETSSGDEEEAEDELAPVRAMLLESSIRSELASQGFSNLGVSVTAEGDVFLNGTFVNPADEDRVLGMLRRNQRVRDIYFSGTVWHNTNPAAEASPSQEAPRSNAGSVAPSTQSSPAKPAASASPAVRPAHWKIAHSTEYPVTAAEVPARSPYAAAPASVPYAAPATLPSASSGSSRKPFWRLW